MELHSLYSLVAEFDFTRIMLATYTQGTVDWTCGAVCCAEYNSRAAFS